MTTRPCNASRALLDALRTLSDPMQHAVGAVEVLSIMADIPDVAGDFHEAAGHFMANCNPMQVQLMPDRFCHVATKYAEIHISSKRNPMEAVGRLNC
jgi:hypothetical protein